MRPIKFRVWHKKAKTMATVFWLDLTKQVAQFGYKGLCYKFPEEIELMQFTGLKDKSGKESYRDDKISFGSTRPVYLVKWSICNAGFYLESMDERKEMLVISNLTVGEVIGNLHESLSLIEEKE